MIGFVGSVFSPYYLAARRRGGSDPENHCAINVALYGRHKRWAMTEHSRRHVIRESLSLTIGRSAMRWAGNNLNITIHERCAPLPWPLRGIITVTPHRFHDSPVMLSHAGNHNWRAVAPVARVHVHFENPKLQWSGHAYHDMNWGDEPLENRFTKWTWLRVSQTNGCWVVYDAERRQASPITFARHFDLNGASDTTVPALHDMPKGLWHMARPVRSENMPQLVSTLEDAPFYTRNHIRMTRSGELCDGVHESLSLDRFAHPVTQWMLPFRMPRKE